MCVCVRARARAHARAQEVRWEKGDTLRAGDYIFFYGKGNENHQLVIGFFVYHRIISATKKEDFVSDWLSHTCIVLRGRWGSECA